MVFALALLGGCGEGVPEVTSAPETTAYEPATIVYTPPTTAPWEPNDPPAVMEPVQGGKMLYTFSGKEPYKWIDDGEGEYPIYPIGLINQDGKLVSPAIYDAIWDTFSDYIYDELGEYRGRIIGFIAQKGQEFTLYHLNGENVKLACKGYGIEVLPGGKYAVIETAKCHVGTAKEKTREGLFDLAENRYLIEPKDGQAIWHDYGGWVMGRQYETASTESKTLAQWEYDIASKAFKQLPTHFGDVYRFLPEASWYQVWSGDYRYYDLDWNLALDLLSYKSRGLWAFEDGGYYFKNENMFDPPTWITHSGEVIEKPGEVLWYPNMRCYLHEKDGQQILYDKCLNKICIPQNGEQLLLVDTPGAGTSGVLLLDANGEAIGGYDLNGKPFPAADAFRGFIGGYSRAYGVKDDKWRTLDLEKFAPEPREGHEEAWLFANVVVTCEDYIVVKTGASWDTEDGTIVYETFAVDWDGKRIDKCPLAPYFDALGWFSNTAGEQGPNYYWVKLDGKRGYINVKGEWLFVDEG